MLFYRTRKKGESSEKLALAFKKLFFGSRLLRRRWERYNTKAPSKRQVREAAITRQTYKDSNNAW